MKGRSGLPNDPKIIVCICFAAPKSKEYTQMIVDVLFRHDAKQKWNRIINIISLGEELVEKQYFNTNIQNIQVLKKLEACIIHKFQ